MKTPLDSETSKAVFGAPEALERLLLKKPALDAACEGLAGRRLWLAGLGTSFHAALAGETLFRSIGSDVRAIRSFDLALYSPPLGRGDAVIALSHGGKTRYTLEAVARARRAGAFTVSLTAAGGGEAGAEARLETVPLERSQAHTVSYLAALLELGRLALALGERARTARPSWARDWERTPELLLSVLDRQGELDAPASQAAGAPAIYSIGGGPNAATAYETALKLKEMAQAKAEPIELETALHGPLSAVNRGDWVLVFAPPGPSSERAGDLCGALDLIGAGRWTVGAPEGGGFPIEGVDEAWTPAVCAVVGQLLALKVSRLKGAPPDNMRCEDPAYEKAFDSYRF